MKGVESHFNFILLPSFNASVASSAFFIKLSAFEVIFGNLAYQFLTTS